MIKVKIETWKMILHKGAKFYHFSNRDVIYTVDDVNLETGNLRLSWISSYNNKAKETSYPLKNANECVRSKEWIII